MHFKHDLNDKLPKLIQKKKIQKSENTPFHEHQDQNSKTLEIF